VSVKTAMTRYAEVRAAVGGVTAIQGASQDYPKKAEALVRNVDLLVFGKQVARSTVDFDRLKADEVESIRRGIFDAQTVKAHYVHLAEGQKRNETSVKEFLRFTESGLFGSATVVIHGTALRREHFAQIAAAGAKLVWSPQSNLRLYDETTDVGAAIAEGVPIALGADWQPSGSPSLLHELKIAWQVIQQTDVPLTPPDLVRMVTSGAAQIAGLDDRIGTLAPGMSADLTVLQRHVDDPYEDVVSAYPSWVELVVIGGDIVYGRPDWIAELSTPEDYEHVTAWGRPMLLDTRFGSPEDAGVDGPPRRLADMRRKLIARYPAVGPIFA
jgi:5-methylthioadenosine/S-adenosylhomocysteine deaminase